MANQQHDGNPQLEDGYTRAANELLDAITAFHFTAREQDVLRTILRLTYGYHKKMEELTNAKIAEAAHMSASHVSATVTDLIAQKALLVEEISSRRRKIGINKRYKQWEKLDKKKRRRMDGSYQDGNVTKMVTYSYQDGNENDTKMVTSTIERKKKETLKESGSVFESLWERYPRKRGKNAVSKKAKAEIEANAADVERALAAYLDEIERRHTSEDYIMHGSTFFNGRWRDYLGAEADAGEQPKKEWKGRKFE